MSQLTAKEHLERASLSEYVKLAAQGNNEALQRACSYLRSHLPLDEDHRLVLADALELKLGKRQRGRPREKFLPPRKALLREIVAIVKRAAQRHKQASNLTRVSRGHMKLLVTEIMARMAEDGDLQFDIEVSDVIGELTKSKAYSGKRK